MHLFSQHMTECVDEKDTRQKHCTNVRCFCVYQEKTRANKKISDKMKNKAPLLENYGSGDAKFQNLTRTRSLSDKKPPAATKIIGSPQAAFLFVGQVIPFNIRDRPNRTFVL